MTAIAIGTAQFGLNYGIANKTGKIDETEVREILNVARKNGADTLDTAIAYGGAEATLGRIGCANWNVVTKLPLIPPDITDVQEWANSEVSKSLLRLNITSLYALLLHAPTDLLGPQGRVLADALLNLKSQGIVSKLGVSVYNPSELEDLRDLQITDLVQAPMNVFDRGLSTTGWLAELAKSGAEIHVRSAFLQGLLVMDPAERPTQFGQWSSLLGQWDNWVTDTKQTPVEACLAHLKSYPEISQIVVGIDNVRQASEIFAANKVAPLRVPEIISSEDHLLINPAKWAER